MSKRAQAKRRIKRAVARRRKQNSGAAGKGGKSGKGAAGASHGGAQARQSHPAGAGDGAARGKYGNALLQAGVDEGVPSVARGGRTGGGAKDKIKSRVRTLLEMGGSRRNGGTSKGAPRSERAKQRGHARNADREHQVQDTAAALISVSGPDGTTGEEEASRRVWPSRVLPRPAGGMLRTGSGGESGSGGAVSPARPHARIGVLAAAAAAAAAAAEQRPSVLTAAPRVVAQLPLRYFNTEGLGPSPNPSPFDRPDSTR